ncbi:MAG: MMPL family transporter [Mycobacteriales bacterium]
MQRLTRFVIAHRKLVCLLWLVLTVAGIATAQKSVNSMDQKFSTPGREGYETNLTIARHFAGTGGDTTPLLAVVKLPAAQRVADPGVRRQLATLEARMVKVIPGGRVAGYASTGNDAFVSKDGHTTFVAAFPTADPSAPFGGNPKAEKAMSKTLDHVSIAGTPVHLTGYEALAAQSGNGNGPGVLVEALLGGLGALVVLAFVFGSFLAIVPLLMAVPAIMTTFLTVLGLTYFTDVSPIVQFLVALIGLGVAIDYSLIVVVRWREERAKGADDDEAIVQAMTRAGRAVVFSGTTVAIGLLALVVLPVPFLRSVGIGGMLIPLISVLVALTLLPAILRSVGAKLDWPHRRTDAHASRFWTRWATLVVRGRWLAAALSVAALVILALSALAIRPGIADVNTLAKAGSAKVGLHDLETSGIGSGALLPHEILVRGADAATVAKAVAQVSGVHGAVAPSGAAWHRDGYSIVDAFASPDGSSKASRTTVDDIRQVAHRQGDGVKLGGQVASNNDFIKAVYGSFPLMIALIAVVTFLLLARAFRSILLPLKAVVLNLLSVSAAWGIMTLVWQEGYGSNLFWGIPATGAISSWIPLMVFAFLFGLSMDYEVFILARMREEYDATGRTDVAVVRGIGRTGKLVTSAALILFLAFVSLASGPETDIKVMATGLAAGILLDATVVRGVLVPAAIALFGRWNWVLPRAFARVLRVEPSPLQHDLPATPDLPEARELQRSR